jgi:hypothetical protein
MKASGVVWGLSINWTTDHGPRTTENALAMSDEKNNDEVNEPTVEYSSLKKTITVFQGFEAMDSDRIKTLSGLSPARRLAAFSRNRKRIFKNILLSDNTFPPFKKTIRLIKLPYEF